jgi:hypothetical protein
VEKFSALLWNFMEFETSLKFQKILPLCPPLSQTNPERRLRWAGQVVRIWYIRNAYKVLLAKPKGKGLSKRRRRLDDKMDLRKMWYEGVVWIHLAQDNDL